MTQTTQPPTPVHAAYIDISDIEDPNTRANEDEADLADLVASIRELGLIQPIVIARNTRFGATTTYQVVAGHRRLRAAIAAGLSHVPAVFRNTVSASEQAILNLVENLQRKDIDAITEAKTLQHLHRSGLLPAEIADRIGKSVPQIYNTLRLLQLPEEVQRLIQTGTLNRTQGILLVSGDVEPGDLEKTVQAMVEEKVSARAMEATLKNEARRRRESARPQKPQLCVSGEPIRVVCRWCNAAEEEIVVEGDLKSLIKRLQDLQDKHSECARSIFG